MTSHARRFFRLLDVSEIALYKVYEATMESDGKLNYSLTEIVGLVLNQIPRNQLRMSLDYLSASNRNFVFENHHNATFSITNKGTLYIEEKLSNERSIPFRLWTTEKFDAFSLAGISSVINVPEDDFDKWQPLEIDRESADYEETIDFVEKSLDQIRGDNGIASEHPKEREGIIEAISRGVEILKEKSPSAKLVRTMLIEPFMAIAKKFGNSLSGNAARIAADRLTTWLQSFL